jgi:Cobalt transport protein
MRGNIDPRWRVLFVLAVAVGIFFLKQPWQVAIVLVVLALLWLVVGLGARALVRQVAKLWVFALFIILSYALLGDDAGAEHWQSFELGSFRIPVDVAAAWTGVLMVLRVLAVVMSSQISRAGDPRAIAAGLGKLGVPEMLALSIDAVLMLLGDVGAGGRGRGGRGGGGGGGGGGGRHREEAPGSESFWQAAKRLLKGDVGAIVSGLERQIARVEEHLGASGIDARKRELIRNVSVVAGVALLMLGIRALKILPSIPFAPGHKLVLLTPLYIIATLIAPTRFGATLTGLTMGIVAFLLGDGRYGIFEIMKHVTPGLICDAILPPLMASGRMPSGLVFSVVGGIIAAGRFATIFLVTLAVQPPAVAYAILLPGLAVHVTFGVISGYVSYHLVRATTHLFAKRRSKNQPRESE